jgi:hypothetical protein
VAPDGRTRRAVRRASKRAARNQECSRRFPRCATSLSGAFS